MKLKSIKITARALKLVLKVFRKPNDIESLLALGDLLTDTKAFGGYVTQVKSQAGASALIETRYSPGLPSLDDLRQMPEGSLGHGLYRHLHDNGLGLYPYAIAPDATESVYLRERQREIHDLIHTLLGVGIEVSSEAKVNSFILARAAAPISVIIVGGALIQTLFRNPAALATTIRDIAAGLQLGELALSPFGYRWEENLTRPLRDVRLDFGLSLA